MQKRQDGYYPYFTNKGRYGRCLPCSRSGSAVLFFPLFLLQLLHSKAPGVGSGGFLQACLVPEVHHGWKGLTFFQTPLSCHSYTLWQEYWRQNRVDKLSWDLLGWSKGLLKRPWLSGLALGLLMLLSWLEDLPVCKSSGATSGMLVFFLPWLSLLWIFCSVANPFDNRLPP